MSVIRKLKLPDGNTHDIGVHECDIDWGTKNLGGAVFSLGDVYFNDFLKANRFAGLKAAGITVEYSTDAGSTWNAYSTSDLNKRNVFTSSGSLYVGGSGSATVTGDNQLRITIDTGDGGIYTTLRKILIYISTNYSQNCKVTIKAAKQASPDDYVLTICENLVIGGWSGWNVIPCNFTTYGNTSAQYKKIQFTFTQTGLSDTTKKGGLCIGRIYAYGGVGWLTPSNMALHGHAYSWDGDLNVTFPSNVTAAKFVGPLQGNANTATSSAISSALTLNPNGRPASANNNYHDGKLRYYLATSSMTTGKPPKDAQVIHLPWDNQGWDSQIAITTETSELYTRGENGSGVWAEWKKILHTGDLSTSTSSTSTTEAATPSAVKAAYDLANTANGTANTALSGVNGNLIYDHTFTISNGVATFTPHVYQKGAEVTSNYAASCFSWKYRLINGSEVDLTTKSNRGCDVTITNLGYGGHVIGTFTPPA